MVVTHQELQAMCREEQVTYREVHGRERELQSGDVARGLSIWRDVAQGTADSGEQNLHPARLVRWLVPDLFTASSISV
ncbi:hypothetical protein ACS0TY_025396 [Phlomoides rotata]